MDVLTFAVGQHGDIFMTLSSGAAAAENPLLLLPTNASLDDATE